MKILFLSRAHPPIVGGLENQSYNLIHHFKALNEETYSVINLKGKKGLPWFVFYSFFKSLNLIRKHRITHLHLSDGVLAPVGYLLKLMTGVKVAVTIHGLDITYASWFYQKLIPWSLNRLDKIICISENTKNECLARSVAGDKITIVSNGVDCGAFGVGDDREKLRDRLAGELGIQLQGKIVLFTSGRLVKRKGVEWFVSHVMPELSEDYLYLVCGDGEERRNIEAAITENKLEDRVILLGTISFSILKQLYHAADLFIMPNISVPGNVEGFGLVAVEAGSCGLTVVAAEVDGIPAAIIDGKTGWLVEEKSVDGFMIQIKDGILEREAVRRAVQDTFDWSKIVVKYREAIQE